MTRLLTSPAILGILVSGTIAAGLSAGCTSNSAGLGLHRGDAQAPSPDAAPSKGGAAGAGSDAAAAGRGGSGGVSGGGGATATGGVAQTGGTAGAGGATGGGGVTGGSPPSGGNTGGGGTTGAGGATATGGSARTGGATGFGGTTQTGGATGTGGSTRTGGATGTGGSPQTGGTTGTGGATRTGGATGAGGTAGAGGATRTGGATASGGSTGAGGSTRTGGTTASGGATGTGGTGGGTGNTCGGLPGYSCAAGEICDLPTGHCCCDYFGTCVVKPQICSDVYLPVCGCDGKTYPNDCDRQAAGVSKKADGACATGDASAVACGLVTTQAACDSRSDCHSVFVAPGPCNCVPVGCCAYFSRCADGGQANCSVPATLACAIAPPFCETPFVLSYTAVCYEGCVRPSECAGADAATTSPAQN